MKETNPNKNRKALKGKHNGNTVRQKDDISAMIKATLGLPGYCCLFSTTHVA